jgi:ATP-dependent RNA circularization protein (DNA/RNA ligase family)
MTVKTRDRHDLIIVQEKLDGSNVSVAKINSEIVALTRAGYTAISSPFNQHHKFDEWVMNDCNKWKEILEEGERICGEWLYQAHGTKYNMPHAPFVPFDIMVGKERITYEELSLRLLPSYGLITPKLIHIGQSYPLEHAIKKIEKSGHGAIDPVEGVVYRCERNGKVDFLAKYVRPDKLDGKYLPEISGKPEVINLFK